MSKLRADTMMSADPDRGAVVFFKGVDTYVYKDNPFVALRYADEFIDWASDKIPSQHYRIMASYVSFNNREDALMAYLAFR